MDDIKITLTMSVNDGKKYSHLRGRQMWHWALEYCGQTFDDAGHEAMEVDLSADSAIAKYRSLLHDENTARMRAKSGDRPALRVVRPPRLSRDPARMAASLQTLSHRVNKLEAARPNGDEAA